MRVDAPDSHTRTFILGRPSALTFLTWYLIFFENRRVRRFSLYRNTLASLNNPPPSENKSICASLACQIPQISSHFSHYPLLRITFNYFINKDNSVISLEINPHFLLFFKAYFEWINKKNLWFTMLPSLSMTLVIKHHI